MPRIHPKFNLVVPWMSQHVRTVLFATCFIQLTYVDLTYYKKLPYVIPKVQQKLNPHLRRMENDIMILWHQRSTS